MASSDKRMGLYTAVPSVFQRTEQFRVLDDALSPPPYCEILAPGSERDLPSRAVKRRKILALADDVLHGRPLYISSAVIGSQALQHNIELRLKEQTRRWPQVSKTKPCPAAWKDVDDVWATLYHAQLDRHNAQHTGFSTVSPSVTRSDRTSRNAVHLTGGESISQAQVIDETVLSPHLARESSSTTHTKRAADHDTMKPRQPRTTSSNSTAKAATVKTHRRPSLPQQTVLTTSYKKSKSSQMSTDEKDNDDVDEEPAVSISKCIALPEHGSGQPTEKEVSRLGDTSPFRYRKRKPRLKRTSEATTARAEHQEVAEQRACNMPNAESDMVEPASISSDRSKHLTPDSKDPDCVSAMHSMVQPTPASIRCKPRQTSLGFNADLAQADDLPCPASARTDTHERAPIKGHRVSATGNAAWPGTQVLIEQAHEALFESPAEQSILALRADQSVGRSDVPGRQPQRAEALETQDIMDAWSPWSANKTQRRNPHRGSILPPTVDPKQLFRNHAQSSPKRGSRSSLCFSLGFSPSNYDTIDPPQSRWTPVNYSSGNGKQQKDKRHSRGSDVHTTNVTDYQAAQADSITRDRTEMEMDRDITELADELFNSPST